MSKMQIKFISKGFRSILLSKGVKEIIAQQGEAIKTRAEGLAGNGAVYNANTLYAKYGGGRWACWVQPGNTEAVIAEAEKKALSRAVK